MELLIDDVRDFGDVIARTPAAAKMILKSFGKDFEVVHFDHDLGMCEESGYSILTWALENDLLPDKIELVTGNIVGREHMRAALENHGFKTINGRTFHKKSP
jgi:hypothetical protein